MTTRILPAVGDTDSARALTTLLSQLPDAEPAAPVADSTALLDTLARLAAESLDELPEVVLVHERIGPVPALDLIREVVLRFPAVGRRPHHRRRQHRRTDRRHGLRRPRHHRPAPRLRGPRRTRPGRRRLVARHAAPSRQRHAGVVLGPRRHRRHGHRREGRCGRDRHGRPTRPRGTGVGPYGRTAGPGPPVGRRGLVPRRAVPPIRRRPRRDQRHQPTRPPGRRLHPRLRARAAARPGGGRARRGGHRPGGPPGPPGAALPATRSWSSTAAPR